MESDFLFKVNKPIVEAVNPDKKQRQELLEKRKTSVQASTNQLSSFGMPHFTDARYFPEYVSELRGRSSPGIYKYMYEYESCF